tara:strand:- start:1438 stop:1731 length:294 start_codon:yes stop_codon:yes gene_type:complete
MSLKLKINNVITGKMKTAFISVKSIIIDKAVDSKTKKEFWDIRIVAVAFGEKTKKTPLPFPHSVHRIKSLKGITGNPVEFAYNYLKTLPAFKGSTDI